jgi:RNA polymerase-binding transcription factor DksA
VTWWTGTAARHCGKRATSGGPARLEAALAENAAQLAALHRQHDEIVAASRDSNADDEHDPEGATIAFERQQVVALLEQLQRTRADIERALVAPDHGRCERCGGAIGEARLEARPTARTCIDCARLRA